MSEELKPCPFCGSTDIEIHKSQNELLDECEKALSQFVNRGYFDRNYYVGLLTKLQERKQTNETKPQI